MKLCVEVICFSLLLILLNAKTSYATEHTFFNEHAQGWHWYQTPKSSTEPRLSALAAMHPTLAMTLWHQRLNAALDKAILVPTRENVAAYMRLQNRMTQLASEFTQNWKHVLLEQPKLNYALTHPTSSEGREIYLNQRASNQQNAIKAFAKQEGLFFFYRGDCPYCHRFAPILKAFTEKYGIHVVPISMGAGFLPDFPNSKVDSGQAARLHVQVAPSLFAVNLKTHRIVPLAYGLMSEAALSQRVANLWRQLHPSAAHSGEALWSS